MIYACEEDKVRFIDTMAESHSTRIHSVEISDHRSAAFFASLYCKGNVKPWINEGEAHDRSLYHREQDPSEWIYHQFPLQDGKGWESHFHLIFDRPAQWSDLEKYAEEMDSALITELRGYLDGNELHL